MHVSSEQRWICFMVYAQPVHISSTPAGFMTLTIALKLWRNILFWPQCTTVEAPVPSALKKTEAKNGLSPRRNVSFNVSLVVNNLRGMFNNISAAANKSTRKVFLASFRINICSRNFIAIQGLFNNMKESSSNKKMFQWWDKFKKLKSFLNVVKKQLFLS